MFIAGAVLIALDPPDWKSGTQSELYQTKRKNKPHGLDQLPSSYDRIPKLGPPNPGDIGKSLARLESDLDIKPPATNPIPSYRPDPEADFLRAERIRLARLKSQAQESGVFFTIIRKQSSAVDAKTLNENVNSNNNRQTELDALTALTNAVGAEPDTTDATSNPNGQRTKLAFLQKRPDAEIYNKNAQQSPASPYQLMAGTARA